VPVGQNQPDCGGADQVGGPVGEHVQELDQVEFVDQVSAISTKMVASRSAETVVMPASRHQRVGSPGSWAISVEAQLAGYNVTGDVAQAAILGVGVGVGPHPGHGLTDRPCDLHHRHALGLEQFGPVVDRVVVVAGFLMVEQGCHGDVREGQSVAELIM
jgi:hypothetical protein